MKNLKLIRILILEDDLETVSILTDRLARLDKDLSEITISVTVLSEYYQVGEYVNGLHKNRFNIVLLDRDCAIGGSFHELDIENIGPEKIISISSVPPYNDDAVQRGVSKVVFKDYKNLDSFADSVIGNVKKMFDSENTLYEKAKELAIRERKMSAGMLQRELQISYVMSAKLLDILESDGVIGPAQGSKAREVLK